MEEYGQRHELAFIDNLGRWSSARRREKCLRGYIASLDTRTEWFDGVDVAALRARAVALLG